MWMAKFKLEYCIKVAILREKTLQARPELVETSSIVTTTPRIFVRISDEVVALWWNILSFCILLMKGAGGHSFIWSFGLKSKSIEPS